MSHLIPTGLLSYYFLSQAARCNSYLHHNNYTVAYFIFLHSLLYFIQMSPVIKLHTEIIFYRHREGII